VSESVVVCVSEPEIAETVTVEVPVETGFGFVEPLFVALHPLTEMRTKRRDKAPPPRESHPDPVLRLRIMGQRTARPNGSIAPAAATSFTGGRCSRDTEYGFGAGLVYVPAVIVRVVAAVAPEAGVTELGENWKLAPVGSPETENVTGALKPLAGRTLT
jgi:hypothetical protein